MVKRKIKRSGTSAKRIAFMNLENFSSFTSCLNEISQSVRKITLKKNNLENNYKLKTDDSPVTKYDIEAENYIRKYLENNFPFHNIIGEELKVTDKKSEFTWIIDPIDGTKSYISGRPLWGTMIGLLKNNKPIIGMVDFPELDQLWIGYKDKLILNGNDCNFLEKKNLTLKNSIFASTAPELFEFLNLQKINTIIDNVKYNIWSGDCHNYILLAQGKIDLVIEENLNSWDILPLIPILKSRKMSITDWNGSEILFDYKTKKKFKVIAACDKDLLNEVLKFLN